MIPEVSGAIGGTIGKEAIVAKKRYQMHLKSLEGQIYVLLVNKDSENEQPLVVQVSFEIFFFLLLKGLML